MAKAHDLKAPGCQEVLHERAVLHVHHVCSPVVEHRLCKPQASQVHRALGQHGRDAVDVDQGQWLEN